MLRRFIVSNSNGSTTVGRPVQFLPNLQNVNIQANSTYDSVFICIYSLKLLASNILVTAWSIPLGWANIYLLSFSPLVCTDGLSGLKGSFKNSSSSCSLLISWRNSIRLALSYLHKNSLSLVVISYKLCILGVTDGDGILVWELTLERV